jgi:endonuclease/exonuclease/phosphatase family metal-dependent hydrolase
MLSHDQMPIEAKAEAISESLTEHKTSQEFVRNISVLATSGIRRTILVLMLVVGLAYQSAHRARADQNENTIKIMTQNMDAGTDFGYVTNPFLGFLPGPGGFLQFLQGAYLTYLEINASNFAYRASVLAGEIHSNHPALVGLQEVTLWRTEPLNFSTTTPSATTVLFDQLNLLLTDLANEYTAVAVQTLADVEVPVPPFPQLVPAPGFTGLNVRYTDQNVVLVRTDLMQQLALSNIQKHQFTTQSSLASPLGPIQILRGWISVDVQAQGQGNTPFRFVTTHLDTDPGFQVSQAKELVQALNSTHNLPVVLCGDFNADADTQNNLTIGAILNGGFIDVWHKLHPLDPGFTIELYTEDFPSPAPPAFPPPPPFTAPSTPSQRIDLVFVRHLSATQIGRIGIFPPLPSDHTGVIASIPPNQ